MSVRRLTLLVTGSGFCALTYQVAWLRLLRLVFGASTAASAAVLAIFMGGLGLGGLMLGRRADATRNPLRLYAYLEAGVALAAALSPLLIALVRSAYIAVGGTTTLGLIGGTALRLALSALVLGVPTVLMGGTLPAIVRAAEYAGGMRRRNLGVLYGKNTLGAVAGTLWTTFVSLESMGTRATIWSASVLNLGVASIALLLARRFTPSQHAGDRKPRGRTPIAAAPGVSATRKRGSGSQTSSSTTTSRAPNLPRNAAPVWLVLVAAGVVGFAFLLMELVWYRMLAPLLGGSSYTFGLILAVALLGIGVGGLAYAAGERGRRPTLATFALTCALEACCIAVPYALGDRVALFALAQRQGVVGLWDLGQGWLLVTLLVVFPGAAVSGYQFPLLVGLLGSGERAVGKDVGRTYASNTLGAIVGSLAGGFGLLPLLSAPGLWRAVVHLLVALAVAIVLYAVRAGNTSRRDIMALAAGAAAILSCAAQGPTAFWRHSPIGAGRQPPAPNPNAVRAALNSRRLAVIWEADGVESSVALDRRSSISMQVNGKSDGNAIDDAPTQVMLGLIGAVFHPHPKRALVIGLGTGETAGWLARVPSIEDVEVFELEPVVVHVAEECALANENVLTNPKVHIKFGDARELLQTEPTTYDVIVSEPSNPYRAGTASLFTSEFYHAVATRLGASGVFVQWVQAYEVDVRTLRSICATLGGVFPSVETWETKIEADLAFVARREAPVHDVGLVRARVETEPYRSALELVWGVSGAEGLYTGFAAGSDFPATFRASGDAPVNTDDLTALEFAFARSVGRHQPFSVYSGVRSVAAAHGDDRPTLVNGTLDASVVEELRAVRTVAEGETHLPAVAGDPAFQHRLSARQAYANDKLDEAREQWAAQSEEPKALGDVRMVADILTDAGDPRARPYIEGLRVSQPVEAEALLALWHHQASEPSIAADHLVRAFEMYRQHPWTNPRLFNRTFYLAAQLSVEHPELAERLLSALSEPFAVHALDSTRLATGTSIGLQRGLERLCIPSLAPLEPNVLWSKYLLERRYDCYSRFHHPLTAAARADLDAFLADPPSKSPPSPPIVPPSR